MKHCFSFLLLFLSFGNISSGASLSYLSNTFKNIITSNYYDKNSSKLNDGEFLKYRMHYGILNAGFATLTTTKESYKGTSCYHVVGKGSSTGTVRAFFKVDDIYETYMDEKYLSMKFNRDIKEGKYVRNQTMLIDNNTKKLSYTNNIKKETRNFIFTGEMHDIISAFYYLRNINTDNLKDGDEIKLNIFMDNETLNFKLKILAREEKRTKFGTIKCIKLRPYVLSGRVFKEKESVTMWVSDDKNHIPIQIKASLAVGSLKADLIEYDKLPYSIDFK